MNQRRSRESNLWQWLQAGAPLGAFMVRIENSIDRGTPDVFGVCGKAFCCELKSVGRRPDGTVWPELKTEQAMFLRSWARCGGNSWVLIQVGVGRVAKKYLIPGMKSNELTAVLPESRLENLSVISSKDDATWIIERMGS